MRDGGGKRPTPSFYPPPPSTTKGETLNNLTLVVPFRNGHKTIDALLDSVPPLLSVVIVDDCSTEPLQLNRENTTVIRLDKRGYFSGAVNAGLNLCKTDAVIVNQDLIFKNHNWVSRVDELRKEHALFGDPVIGHPAWPKGYIQGTFMFMRRDAIETIGNLNAKEYPLWGATCEWQLRLVRSGFSVYISKEWDQWIQHEKRGRGQFGSAVNQALQDEPQKRFWFLHTPPEISVIIPCYNYGRFLPDAINSLIGGKTSLGEMPGQTFKSFEIVIVDDASTDNSWEVISSFADSKKAIRAIKLEKNHGTPGALNEGIRQAHGRYIHVLSADDMREPWCLESLLRGCRKNQRSVAYGDVTIFKNGERKRVFSLPRYNFEQLLYRNFMPAGIMYPKKAWEETGGYPEGMKYGREDWAFNIALGVKGWCGVHVGDSGNLYRRERHNRSLRSGNTHKRLGERPPDDKFNWHEYFRKQLRALFPEIYQGERPKMCCGRGTRRNRPAAPVAAPLPGKNGMVLLEYTGQRSGTSSWYGPQTGARYRFGRADRHRIGYVDLRDATPMLALKERGKLIFRSYSTPEPVPPPPQEEAERVLA
jgi:glycosyltransferase involved in cell wall biosynthesis